MSSPFSMFHNDRITIARPDGTLVGENIPADVQTGKKLTIFTEAVHLAIQPGDIVSRTLPSGVIERFVVVEPGFDAGMMPGLPSSYQMVVRREGTEPRHAPLHVTMSGANSRLNISSIDASHNVVEGSTDELFRALSQALQAIADTSEREHLLAEATILKNEVGKATFRERYTNFVTLAAAHMELVAPFMVPLTALLHPR